MFLLFWQRRCTASEEEMFLLWACIVELWVQRDVGE